MLYNYDINIVSTCDAACTIVDSQILIIATTVCIFIHKIFAIHFLCQDIFVNFECAQYIKSTMAIVT